MIKQHQNIIFDNPIPANVVGATDNDAAGHMWPAGLGLDQPVLEH